MSLSRDIRSLTLVPTGIATYDSLNRVFARYLTEDGAALTLASMKQAFLRMERDGYKPATLQTLKAAVKKSILLSAGSAGFDARYRAIVNEALKDLKVARKIKAISPDQIISEEETRILIGGCRSKRIATIMWLLSVTGLRISELTSLRLDQIEMINEKTAVVSVLGKGRKERRIFLPTSAIRDAIDLFKSRVYLIETVEHKRYCRKYLWREISVEGRRILGRPIHPHMFRHAWATHKISGKKLSVKAVSLYLGHSNVSTTFEFYHHDQLTFSDLFGEENHAHVAS